MYMFLYITNIHIICTYLQLYICIRCTSHLCTYALEVFLFLLYCVHIEQHYLHLLTCENVDVKLLAESNKTVCFFYMFPFVFIIRLSRKHYRKTIVKKHLCKPSDFIAVIYILSKMIQDDHILTHTDDPAMDCT